MCVQHQYVRQAFFTHTSTYWYYKCMYSSKVGIPSHFVLSSPKNLFTDFSFGIIKANTAHKCVANTTNAMAIGLRFVFTINSEAMVSLFHQRPKAVAVPLNRPEMTSAFIACIHYIINYFMCEFV